MKALSVLSGLIIALGLASAIGWAWSQAMLFILQVFMMAGIALGVPVCIADAVAAVKAAGIRRKLIFAAFGVAALLSVCWMVFVLARADFGRWP